MKEWNGRRAATLTAAVLNRDGYRCCWCGGRATTAEHIVPRSRGGSDDLGNLAAACLPCNASRGNRDRPGPRRRAVPSREW